MNENEKQVLHDEHNKKIIDWRGKKIKSLAVADSFQRLGYEKKSERMRFCGSMLAFVPDTDTGKKRLHSANFCRERLCPMCQWRRSLKIFRQVSKTMDKTGELYPNLVPLFLTLTLRNCAGNELKETLDIIFHGWHELFRIAKVKRVVKGWFRALEVTYNKEADTFHPHIHAIILVDKSYFRRSNKDYMDTYQWAKLWQKALKLDYEPVCDIRKIQNRKGKYKAVAEVAKYTLKDSDFLYLGDTCLTDRLVEILHIALKGRRLFAFGGVLKTVAKELGLEELGEGDLIHLDDEIREDVSKVIEVYRWNYGLVNYYRDENSPC